MKKVIIAGLAVLLLAACEDEEGPAGPPGGDFLGQVFEFDDVSFDYNSVLGVWSTLIPVPSDIDVRESDVILAYRWLGTAPETGDDIWEALPNVYFLPEGTIQYVFNHTRSDVELTIDGNFDLSNLDTDFTGDDSFTDDQIFRFVVAPADFVNQIGVDVSDYEAVVKALGAVGDHQL